MVAHDRRQRVIKILRHHKVVRQCHGKGGAFQFGR
jgi:hypothetical protein